MFCNWFKYSFIKDLEKPLVSIIAVSYTHLDVYKRQTLQRMIFNITVYIYLVSFIA